MFLTVLYIKIPLFVHNTIPWLFTTLAKFFIAFLVKHFSSCNNQNYHLHFYRDLGTWDKLLQSMEIWARSHLVCTVYLKQLLSFFVLFLSSFEKLWFSLFFLHPFNCSGGLLLIIVRNWLPDGENSGTCLHNKDWQSLL